MGTFIGCNMQHHRSSANYTSVSFSDCNLQHAAVGHQQNTSFYHCDMRNFIFRSSYLNCVFEKCDLFNSQFHSVGSAGSNNNFNNSILRNVKFRGVTQSTRFVNCDCRGIDFDCDNTGMYVVAVSTFDNSDLRYANFPYNENIPGYYLPQNNFENCKLAGTPLAEKAVRDILSNAMWGNVFAEDNDYITPDDSTFDFRADRHSFFLTVADVGIRSGISLDDGAASLFCSKEVSLISGGALSLTAKADMEDEGIIHYNLATGKWQAQNAGGEAFDIGDMRKEAYDVNGNGEVDIAELARSVEYIELVPEPADRQILIYEATTAKFKPGNLPGRNIDGGSASTVYLSGQIYDGGGASG